VELPSTRGAKCAKCGSNISQSTSALRVVHYHHHKLPSGVYTHLASSTRSFCLIRYRAEGLSGSVTCLTGAMPADCRLATDRLTGGVEGLSGDVQRELLRILHSRST
jgi:hypothetical protein